ncbi:MAG: hypothetical protein AAGA68_15350 [Pseudomonadota bacterium]
MPLATAPWGVDTNRSRPANRCENRFYDGLLAFGDIADGDQIEVTVEQRLRHLALRVCPYAD